MLKHERIARARHYMKLAEDELALAHAIGPAPEWSNSTGRETLLQEELAQIAIEKAGLEDSISLGAERGY